MHPNLRSLALRSIPLSLSALAVSGLALSQGRAWAKPFGDDFGRNGARFGHGPAMDCDRDGRGDRDDRNDRGEFRVGLFGDMPYAKIGYGGVDGAQMQAIIKDMNEADLAFSIFDGDTKDGSSQCTEANILTEPAKLFNSLEAPVVYVPGDNEWTDCHRTNNGGYDPLERLDFIRRNMHNTPFSYGKRKMKLERQGYPGEAYSENTRWTKGNVVFVGINMPGSNNNKVNPGTCLGSKTKRTQADCDADNAEYAERNARNLAWVGESFALAKARKSPGIMIAFQADPGFDWPETEDVNERETLPDIDGFTDLLDLVAAQAADYEGEIVLVHGDTHFFKIDKPLLTPLKLIPNITRVMTFGEGKVHWVMATVRPGSRNVFTFEPMMVPGN